MNSLLKKLTLLIIGFLIVFYVIYIRLIINRAPKNLEMFNPTNWSLIFICLCWIIISIFIIYKSIQNILDIEPSINFIQKYILKILVIIDKSLVEVYALITNNIGYDYITSSKISEKFYNIFGKKTEALFVYITIICKLILVFVFLIDTFYFFELKYYYKALIILCVPICISLLFFMLSDFAKNLEETKSYLIITKKGINPETNEPIYSFTPSIGNEDINLSYHIKEFALCSKLNGYLEGYRFCSNYYNVRFNLIIYGLYIISWLYILYCNFNNYIFYP